MDIDILKIALAGLLHDIGKFIERTGEEIPDDYIANNQFLYQHKYEGRYSHKHALYTAYFIETFRDYFPKELIDHSSHEISLINLAAKHHNPNSIEQKIIQEADYLSSGIERKEFEEANESVRKAFEIPLFPILEDISITENWRENKPENFKFSYPLKEISPLTIFPQQKHNYNKEIYKELYEKFIKVFQQLPHKENPILWMEHLDSALFVFTSSIPSATLTQTRDGFKEIISDISLYDHGRLTSAIAIALYLYHKETGTLNENAITDKEVKKFLLIEGNFYGIQDFIFSEGASTSKNAAKILRGRSFYVSLLSELSADFVLQRLGLPFTSVVINAAGRFKIIAPNTENSIKIINQTERDINKWLIENFYGEVSLGITYLEATSNDFIDKEKVYELYKNMGQVSEEKKYKKIDITEHGGSFSSYLDNFLGANICPVCNRRPNKQKNKIKDENLCDICYDHVKIGESLVKKDIIVIATKDAELEEKLRIPIFGKYQLSFVSGKLSKLVKEGKIIHYWNLNYLWNNEPPFKDFASIKLINGYVPKFTEEYKKDIDKLKYKESPDEIKEIEEFLMEGSILSFHHIAKLALMHSESGFTGIDAIGVFKADIDNLGTIFSRGLRYEKRTFSRYTTLSRQLNLFFTLYLPYLCKKEFKNIYTIFAGGDDLFLIGPWNEMIEFSKRISNDFSSYCCKNPEISLSAGLFITKPETPVFTMAEESEKSLNKAKIEGKNRITIFNITLPWDKLSEIEIIREHLDSWLQNKILSTAFMYKLNEILSMAEKEIQIIKKQDFKELNPLTWRAKLYYFVTRNVAKKSNVSQEEILNKLVSWIDNYRESFRIPLWQTLYLRRKA